VGSQLFGIPFEQDWPKNWPKKLAQNKDRAAKNYEAPREIFSSEISFLISF
jgi:hypothetical protein